MNTFNSEKHPAGTLGYHAAIDRPLGSKAKTARTGKYPTRAAAVAACLSVIDRDRIRVKPTDRIETTEWKATGDGGWQCELMKLLASCESLSVAEAKAAARAALDSVRADKAAAK